MAEEAENETVREDDLPFMAEYAKSSRASCKQCKGNIAKESLRLAVMIQSPKFDGKMPNWFHYACFFGRNRIKTVADIKNFDQLRWEDQQKIKEKIVPHGEGGVQVGSGAGDATDYGVDSAKSSRSKCRGCETNIVKGNVRVSVKDYDSVNAKRFGPVDKWYHLQCFVDQREEFEFYASGAILPGFDLLKPDEQSLVKDKLPEMKDKKAVKRPAEVEPQSAKKPKIDPKEEKLLKDQNKLIFGFRDSLKTLQKKELSLLLEENNQAIPAGESKMLDRLSDCMAFGALEPCPECPDGQLSYGAGGYHCRGNLTEWTKCMYVTKTPKRVPFVIPEELKEDHPFLAKYKFKTRARLFPTITEKPSVGKSSDQVDGASSSASNGKSGRYTKSGPSLQKITLKGSSTVDAASGLASRAHVLEEKGNIYSAVLGMVDVSHGTNSYYKLQLLESDEKVGKYWVFRAWGRIGTEIGGTKVENMSDKITAKSHFKSVYEEKTGNSWSDRRNFVKYPNRFYPVDIDYGEDNIKKLQDIESKTASKLPKPVQDIICMIFDVESMKKTMLEFEIDLNKMPLGKLSRRQIDSAYGVLSELHRLIGSGGTESKFLDGSNRFYTLIPHDFGLKKPPLLNNEELINTKVEMLDSLMEMEIAYSILKGAEESDKHPIDSHYDKLNTTIEILEKESDEFKLLIDYAKNTHGATHNQYTLEVKEVFKIVREKEASRYKPFKKLPNRTLLWHGSRVTNYAGILSQGLRIAPPEAPVTGYMFGKGIYFADIVSKSANYCFTSKKDPTGLMLLCEVALGNMYELTKAEHVTKLPVGKHSTKGIGKSYPDPSQNHVTKDGVVIPLGKPVEDTTLATTLLYNEYIVYDVAQVNAKYLLQVDFKYKF